MADENKKPLFGGKAAESESDDAPKVSDAEANASKTTSPDSQPEGKPDASVTDAEAEALEGAGGPNRTPAFVKRDFEDENVQLTDTSRAQRSVQPLLLAQPRIGLGFRLPKRPVLFLKGVKTKSNIRLRQSPNSESDRSNSEMESFG